MIDREKHYALNEAVGLVKTNASSKFDETVEIAVILGVDPRHSDQMVRGMVSLPNGTGRSVRVAVFAKDANIEVAKEAGADIVGGEELAAQVQKGEIDFDRCISTPDMMSVVGKLGKVLGPRGLMPNPKLGTVTKDVAEAVKAATGGQASFSEEALSQNIAAFVGAIQKARPSGAKGIYMKKVALSSTMGPGIKLDLATLSAG